MCNDNYALLQTTAAGLGVLIVTLLTAQGEWDVFDIAISIALLGLGCVSLQARKLVLTKSWHIAIGAICFGIVTTCGVIASISTVSVIFQCHELAMVDIQTYHHLPKLKSVIIVTDADLYQSQMKWQLSVFTISSLLWAFFLFFCISHHRVRLLECRKSQKILSRDKPTYHSTSTPPKGGSSVISSVIS